MGFGSLFGSSKSEKTAKRAVAIQQENLEMARAQAKLFQPLFKQFSNLYTDVTLDDITSGRVVSPSTASVIADIQRTTKSQASSLDESLSRSNVPDSAAEIIRQNLFTESRRDINRAKALGRDAEVQNRLGFLNFGREANQSAISAGNTAASALFNLSGIQAENEAAEGALLGDIAGSAAFLGATALFPGAAPAAAAASPLLKREGSSAVSGSSFGPGKLERGFRFPSEGDF